MRSEAGVLTIVQDVLPALRCPGLGPSPAAMDSASGSGSGAKAAGTSSAKDTMRTEAVRLASAASSSAEAQLLGVGLSAWWRTKAARMTTNMCTSIAAPGRKRI